MVACGMASPNAISYAQHRSGSHDAVIRVYDATGNVIETQSYASNNSRTPPRPNHNAAEI